LGEYMLSAACLFRGRAYLEMESYVAARTSLDEALRLSRANQERWFEGLSLIYLGATMGKLDIINTRKAEEHIQQGIFVHEERKHRPSAAVGYLHLGELYADAGRRQEALETLKKARGMFQEMGMDYWLARTEKAL
jgi:tetratricopeptide (TPR) repeat protein